jgi:hypothetical protein
MMKAKTSAFDSLNPSQRRAATFGTAVPEKGVSAGPLLILAGAGTGKTNTLAHRTAHLVLNGTDPSRIMMLTFTRRAAQEMIKRTQTIVAEVLADKGKAGDRSVISRLIWGGTFHSVGSRILRLYAKHLGLDPNFTVLDRSDAADIMDVIRHEFGFSGKEKRFPRKDACLGIYSYRVNTRLSLKQTLEEQFPWCREWEADLTKLYREESGEEFRSYPGGRVSGHQHLAGRNRQRAEAGWQGRHRGRRRCASHLLIPRRGGGKHPGFRRSLQAEGGHDRTVPELPLDPADLGFGQCADGGWLAPASQDADGHAPIQFEAILRGAG